MEKYNLTNHLERSYPIVEKTIVEVTVRLDRNTMLDLLRAKAIRINGDYFKVPVNNLLQCLLYDNYGETKLELEKL